MEMYVERSSEGAADSENHIPPPLNPPHEAVLPGTALHCGRDMKESGAV